MGRGWAAAQGWLEAGHQQPCSCGAGQVLLAPHRCTIATAAAAPPPPLHHRRRRLQRALCARVLASLACNWPPGSVRGARWALRVAPGSAALTPAGQQQRARQ